MVAGYFAFWAKFVLRRWQPQIVVITGSSGKTTLLHLLESQIGDRAIYSHHANSAIGIPFHILGLQPNVSSKAGWAKHFLKAPFFAFKASPEVNLYIVEADCDRPNEGRFTSRLLKPDVTLWVSVYNTHSMNFDKLVRNNSFKTHEEAIAYEFGNFIENTTKLAAVNGDQVGIANQLGRVKSGVEIKKVSMSKISEYKMTQTATTYKIHGQTFNVSGIHPKDLGIGIQLTESLLNFLRFPLDPDFKNLKMPPGRSSTFLGKKELVLIDSTYNTGLGAAQAMFKMFEAYPSDDKWLVAGDMLEQGSIEKAEHEKLAAAIAEIKVSHVVLLGRRTKQYTYPLLKNKLKVPVVSFDSPKEVLDYLTNNTPAKAAILFKGAFGLEGVIEELLANPSDADNLVRREAVWTKRRQKWGLPK